MTRDAITIDRPALTREALNPLDWSVTEPALDENAEAIVAAMSEQYPAARARRLTFAAVRYALQQHGERIRALCAAGTTATVKTQTDGGAAREHPAQTDCLTIHTTTRGGEVIEHEVFLGRGASRRAKAGDQGRLRMVETRPAEGES